MAEIRKISLTSLLIALVLVGCTSSERRFCARQAGAGDVTCGPAIAANDWRNAR